MKLILLGAPGAGKGTQAEYIMQRLNIPSVSTGNMLREAVKNGTEIGLKAKAFMDSGALVPDDVILGIIKERLAMPDCANGFILDGFPRTVAQAEGMEKFGVMIDKALSIEVPDEAIMTRMSGRRTCPACGASFHTVFNKPQKDGVCDKCGAALVQRDDDKPETVAKRLDTFHAQTEPVKAYYEKKGLLVKVDGEAGVSEITARIFAALGI